MTIIEDDMVERVIQEMRECVKNINISRLPSKESHLTKPAVTLFAYKKSLLE